MKFELIHHFDADIDPFVKAVYFDDALNQALSSMKNISKREVKEITDGPEKAHRVMFIEVAAAIPKEARRFVGERLGWNEVSTLDKKTNVITWQIEPQVKLPIDCQGKYEMVAEGKGKVRRIITGEVKVKLPLVGKKLESFIVNQLVESFEEEEVLVKKFLRELA